MGERTRLQMRAAMRIDLKDSGSLWSDAELNRCIDRAYSDLSRYLPDERITEQSLQFAVTEESITFPANTSLTAIVNAQSINVAAGSLLTIAGQPDMARKLRITITDANNSTYGATFIIRGTDRDENYQEEVFYWTRGDSLTINGKKEFKFIYEVELNQDYGSGAGDTASVGYGAYTDVWVALANSPIKWGTETATDNASVSIVRNTDFYIDYANGRVKAISGGKISASEVCTFAYTKSQIGVDISALANLIRVQRVEYPVGDVPQNFVSFDMFSHYLIITGAGESESQTYLAEDEQYRIYYDAKHQSPGEMSPSTAPDFLEDTVLMVAEAYALFIYALKHEHQALTDLASARTDFAAATTAHTALDTALTNLKKYLDNNTNADAAGILQDITDDTAGLRAAVETALDGIATYVTGGTAPSAKKYLDDGDATLNTVAVGGEGQDVPRAYREYAAACVELSNSLISEANARLTNIITYINQSAGYGTIAATFAREAEDRLAKINAFIQEGSQYALAASYDMTLADRFRAEADERRNEAYTIWRDRKSYIGDFVGSSVRQMPSY